MFQTWEYRISHPWYLSKTLFHLSTFKYQHDRSQKIINEFTDDIIKQKINELKQNYDDEKKPTLNGEDVCQKMKTFIEVLLGNYHKLSHEQIRDELITIMIGNYKIANKTNLYGFHIINFIIKYF